MLIAHESVSVACLALICTIIGFSDATANASICPSKTVNYITHSLPRQCLATSRYSADATHSADTAASIQDSASIGPSIATLNNVARDASHSQAEQASPTVTPTESVDALRHDHDNHVENEDRSRGDVQITPSQDVEEDSPLENSNFMSFEEWKRQNLRRSGQSDHVGQNPQVDFGEPRRRPSSLHNALDSLGDDAEIDIDFSGLLPEGPDASTRESVDKTSDVHVKDASSSLASRQARGSKQDAGTTCKERFNYASFDCAATVLKTNHEARSPNAVLIENKDAYMLNECHAKDKYLILELCNDISIDTIVLANFEFFSSTFRTFRISVSDRYPVKAERWLDLGVFEARNTREVQAFLVENPRIWARYLRIELLTHYGSEFYCPVSLVRVHGTTMLEEYKHDQDSNALEPLEDEQTETEVGLQTDEEEPTPGSIVLPFTDTVLSPADLLSSQSTNVRSPPVSTSVSQPSEVFDEEAVSDAHGPNEQSPASHTAASDAIASIITVPNTCSFSTDTAAFSRTASTSDADKSTVIGTPVTDSDRSLAELGTYSTNSAPSAINSTVAESQSSKKATTSTSSSKSSAVVKGTEAAADTSTTLRQDSPSNVNSTSAKSSSAPARSSSSTVGDRSRSTASVTQSAPAAPTMQESFFKSVQKRLQMLEANSSLSLQYIEDQSRSLRDAFKKVEQRQLSKTTSFLDQLNSTVLNELREFRQQYDQLWQSTVIELELQRERYERDNEAMNARLGVLTDEVIFQRRMGILQMILILICLALVLFSRGSINNYLELPLVQNVLARSQSTRWLNLSGADSPSSSPQVTRARSSHQLRAASGAPKGHRRFPSEDSTTDTLSPTDVYAPPTPTSFDERTQAADDQEESRFIGHEPAGDAVFDDPEFDPAALERPLTSPPMLVYPERLDRPSQERVTAYNTSDLQDSVSIVGNTQTSPPVLVSELSPVTKRLAWNLPNE